MAYKASDGQGFTNLPPMKAHQRSLDARGGAKKSDVLRMPGESGQQQQQADPSQGQEDSTMDAAFAEAHAQGLTPEQVAQAYEQYVQAQGGDQQQGAGDDDGAEYE
jgi:hypothetical protein